MKYPDAEIREGTKRWYVLLQEGNRRAQKKPMYLTKDGKDETFRGSNFDIYFPTKEAA